MQRLLAAAIPTLFLIFGLTVPAGAETTAENAIKYRHAVMDAMGAHTSALSMIAFGMVDHPESLQNHANAIADASGELNGLFPAGSGEGDTHALPAIWEEPDKFSAAVAAAQKAATGLRDAAATGDRKAISGAFRTLGQACKGCHESYREEDDH